MLCFWSAEDLNELSQVLLGWLNVPPRFLLTWRRPQSKVHFHFAIATSYQQLSKQAVDHYNYILPQHHLQNNKERIGAIRTLIYIIIQDENVHSLSLCASTNISASNGSSHTNWTETSDCYRMYETHSCPFIRSRRKYATLLGIHHWRWRWNVSKWWLYWSPNEARICTDGKPKVALVTFFEKTVFGSPCYFS